MNAQLFAQNLNCLTLSSMLQLNTKQNLLCKSCNFFIFDCPPVNLWEPLLSNWTARWGTFGTVIDSIRYNVSATRTSSCIPPDCFNYAFRSLLIMTQDPLSEDTSARHAGKEQEIRAWRPTTEVKPGDQTQEITHRRSTQEIRHRRWDQGSCRSKAFSSGLTNKMTKKQSMTKPKLEN